MENKIKKFLELETGRSISDNGSNLILAGILDSFSVARLIAFIETEFGAEFNMEELSPENFNSVAAISNFVKKMKHGN